MAENLRFQGKVIGARITRTADWWFVSIQVELPDAHPGASTAAAVGIDVGLNRLVTLSTGEGVENQAFLKTALKKLRQANKRLHRRETGIKKPGESAQTGGTPPLPHHLSCVMMSCTSSRHGLPTVTESLALKISTSRDCSKNRHLARSFSDAAIGQTADPA